MKDFFRHFKFSAFGVALLCAALGAAMLIAPDVSQQVFCYAFGIVLALCGVLQVASYFVSGKKTVLGMLMMVGGLIAAVAGGWILLSPGSVLKLTVIVMGILLLYHGVMDVKYAFDVKAAEGKAGLPLVFGMLTCAVGVLLLVNPFGEKLDLLFMVCGIGFVFDGITDIYTVSAVATARKRYELKQAAAQAALNSVQVEALSPAPAEAENLEPESKEGDTLA